MDEREVERLVDAIAAKVRERIGADTVRFACSASSTDCSACGDCVARRPEDTRNIISLGAARLATAPSISGVPSDLAGYIDHTLLKPEATQDQLRTLCEEAKSYGFYSVCVNSANVKFCRNLLAGSPVKTVAVVGFPLGAASTGGKAYEARQAISDGADEIDMVLNIGALKSKDYLCVYEDIRKVVEAVHPRPVKVILETAMLNRNDLVIGCALSKAAGAHFVKTSTGFGPGGATAEDVALMKEIVGTDMEVKASGGINSQQDATTMIRAGATRVGASASIAIVTNKKPAAGSGKY